MKFILLFTFCLVVLTTATDYCKPDLCKQYNGAGYDLKHHIACGNSGDLAPKCSKDAQVVKLTNEHKNLILKTMNELRNKIASGNLDGFQTAQRMPTMTWDDELAKLAVLNVKQCEMKHDQCRNTDKFPFAGQSLSAFGWTGDWSAYDDDTNIKRSINSWYSENQYSSQDEINKYGSVTPSKSTGHFTVMVHQKSAQIGCGIIKYTDGKWKHFLMACDFSFTNLIGEAIYTSGAPCSGCTSGCSSEYNALCSENEKISFKGGE